VASPGVWTDEVPGGMSSGKSRCARIELQMSSSHRGDRLAVLDFGSGAALFSGLYQLRVTFVIECTGLAAAILRRRKSAHDL
jgi:hypothetical protein